MFDFSANDGYDNNYQVDGGLNVAHQSGYRKLANVFTTQAKQGVSSEDLKAVSMSITSKTNVNYTIEIYTDLRIRQSQPAEQSRRLLPLQGRQPMLEYIPFHLKQRLI